MQCEGGPRSEISVCLVTCVPLMGDDIDSQHFEYLLASYTFLPKVLPIYEEHPGAERGHAAQPFVS